MILRNVGDTAQWVAHYRALENERPDALFHDRFARALAGERGAEIVGSLAGARAIGWALVVTTRVIDDILVSAAQRDHVDVIVNLGAGLDARPYRLSLPAGLRWIDIDLPDVLEHRGRVLADAAPSCSVETVALDLADARARHALVARVGASAQRALVVTQGLLAYLAPAEVAALADDLAAEASFASWVTDLVSPDQLRRQQRLWGRELEAARASMRFGPPEGAAFFEPHGWKLDAYHPLFLEARRLGREKHVPWSARLLYSLGPEALRDRIRRAAGVVQLVRAS